MRHSLGLIAPCQKALGAEAHGAFRLMAEAYLLGGEAFHILGEGGLRPLTTKGFGPGVIVDMAESNSLLLKSQKVRELFV